MTADSMGTATGHERRRFPRIEVKGKMTLAIEDETIGESIGLGSAMDLSLGGLRLTNLPTHAGITEGSRLGILIMDTEDALSVHGTVVHHGTSDTFGVEFMNLTAIDGQVISAIVNRLNH